MRFRIFALICAMACLCPLLRSQAGFVTVYGTRVQDASGHLANGTLTAQIAVGGKSVGASSGGGGQFTSPSVSTPIENGTFYIQLPDTSITRPANVCISIAATDDLTGESILGPGLSCVQPTSVANYWCGASGCDLDNYIPNTAAVAPVSLGPVGPQGPPGLGNVTLSDSTLQQYTSAFVGVSSTNQSALLINGIYNALFFPGIDIFDRINHAISACTNTTGYCDIHVPPQLSSTGATNASVYQASTTLDLSTVNRINGRIVFDGGALVNYDGAGTCAITGQGYTTNADGSRTATYSIGEIDNLLLSGVGSSGTASGVCLGELNNVTLTHYQIHDFVNGACLDLAGSDSGNFYDGRLNSCTDGLRMENGPTINYPPNGNHFYGLHVDNMSRHALMSMGAGNAFFGITEDGSQANSDAFFVGVGSNGTFIDGLYLETNPTGGGCLVNISDSTDTSIQNVILLSSTPCFVADGGHGDSFRNVQNGGALTTLVNYTATATHPGTISDITSVANVIGNNPNSLIPLSFNVTCAGGSGPNSNFPCYSAQALKGAVLTGGAGLTFGGLSGIDKNGNVSPGITNTITLSAGCTLLTASGVIIDSSCPKN